MMLYPGSRRLARAPEDRAEHDDELVQEPGGRSNPMHRGHPEKARLTKGFTSSGSVFAAIARTFGASAVTTGYFFSRLVGRLSLGLAILSKGTSGVPLRWANIQGRKFRSPSAVDLGCQWTPLGMMVNIGWP
jgi:hypothetical protein